MSAHDKKMGSLGGPGSMSNRDYRLGRIQYLAGQQLNKTFAEQNANIQKTFKSRPTGPQVSNYSGRQAAPQFGGHSRARSQRRSSVGTFFSKLVGLVAIVGGLIVVLMIYLADHHR